ncbi:organic cation transporter protein-like [Pollicipes pollicipes]|uniref:organic cation transporter protein-like n=1 Tax=Pollicipes pollicipes TaxID=41117 RepID=UPI0018851345|nr:organic cation transporter protein-like [Pollicipes pollicipes]
MSCYIYSEALTEKEIYKYHPNYHSSEQQHAIIKREVTSSDKNAPTEMADSETLPSPKKLRRKQRCSEVEYEDTHGSTMITEWKLSCDNDHRILASTVICVAMLLGGIMFSPFVDKLGRKTLIMMCCVQNTLLAIGVTFVGDFNSYLVLRFLARLYIEGVEVGVLVLAVELVPAKNRPLAPFVLFVAYSLGHCLLPLLAYYFKSWRNFQLTIALGSAVLIPITSFLVPESLNWLVASGRKEEAEKIIRRAARFNGLALPDNFSLDEMDDDDHDKTKEQGKTACATAAHRLQRRVTGMNGRAKQGAGDFMQHEIHAHLGQWARLFDMMKNGQLRKHFIIVSYVWAVVGFLYFGLTTSTMESKGNVYLNYGLSGLVMIPACVSVFLILRRFGRKKPIMVMLAGCGLSVIGSTLCPLQAGDGTDLYPLYVALKMVAKYTTFSALVSIRLLIIEIFPTPVRGSLVGLTAVFGLLGSGLGYYYSVMLDFSKYVGVAAGCLALLASVLCRFLPETSNRPLPDTIHDVMEAYRDVFVNMLSMMGGMGAGGGGGEETANGDQKPPLASPDEQEKMLPDENGGQEAPSPAVKTELPRPASPKWQPNV